MTILRIITKDAVRRCISIVMTIAVISSFCMLSTVFSNTAEAAGTTMSEAPDANCITVTNHAKGTSDTIFVWGLSPKDIVKVYSAVTGGKFLGSKTVSSSGGDATVMITQLGTGAGSVYVSVTSSGYTESSRTEADYSAEPESDAPAAANITVTNNAKGTADTIYVCGLSPKDIVKVYNLETAGKLLGSKTVSSYGSDATVSVSQLGTSAGSVYVSVTSSGYLESSRTEAAYTEEPGSDALDADNITVTNNAAGTSDTVYVSGLSAKDIVKVYNAQTDGKLLGSKTVASTGSDATISITQLGSGAGSVYISVTHSGCTESGRTKAAYQAEGTTETLDAKQITITNNPKGTVDTICVSGVAAKDIIKVYNSETDGKLLGSATVAAGGTSATVSIPQLGIENGTVYISVKSYGYLESSRTGADYDAELASVAPESSDITVTNNAKGTDDTIRVQNLISGDTVKVYSTLTGSAVLGTAVSTGTDVTVSVTQLGTAAGSVYVSVTSKVMGESSRVEADYDDEASSNAPSAGNIIVTNNPSGSSDTVYVSGLNASDVVKIYDKSSSGTVLGTATVAALASTVTISIAQLGASAGSVYISVTATGKTESGRTKIDYTAEAASTAPVASNITVTNYAPATADTVFVAGLKENDVVNVYRTAKKGTVLGTSTVVSGATTATVTISQLGTAAGSVFVTVTSIGATESSCTEAAYIAEASTTAPSSSNITVTNNVKGTDDKVYVSGLVSGDIVKVYDKSSQGTVLGSATVGTSENTVTISIAQLGTGAGSVYVSITGTGKAESSLTKADYISEAVSKAPVEGNITVTNNASGTADTVYVSGLASGDVVNVYKSSSKGTALGTATVADGVTYAAVSITQMGTAAGNVYITVTGKDCLESDCTVASYTAEAKTTELNSSAVSVTNNYQASDVVTVTGLTYGDIINVYDAATSGSLLGTDTVSTYSSTATITIKQLGTIAGNIYISKTQTGKTESTRTAVTYDAEPKSIAPSVGNVTIINNASAADTIAVIGLLEGDVVTAYKTATGSNTWGSGTVSASNSAVTITVSQLGTSSGSVYISVTSANAAESSRTAVTYMAETPSTAPTASCVTVVNNYNIASTITVTGLANNDIVDVYNASSGGTLLGSGTVSSYGTSVAISLSSLAAAGGTVYLTVTSTNESESPRTAVTYSAQTVSTAPTASNVTIVNNADIADTITVKNTSKGAIIKVYNASSSGDLLGTATATGTSVAISIDQVGESAGSVYMTATTTGKTESARTAVSYTAESASDAIQSGNVKTVNNSGAADTITITGLSSGDVVKVYKTSSSTTAISTTTATGTLSTVISISQFGTSAGSVYLTVTTSGKMESSKTQIDYLAESTAPTSSQVSIVNNAGISDTITVSGINASDIVNVYSDSAGKTVLGTATASSGSTTAAITVSQLSSAAGYVYISVIDSGCAESSLTKVSYLAEQTTDAPDEGNIYVENNAGTSDTITVSNLNVGDVVKVYSAASNGDLRGKATVVSGSTSATVTIAELGTSSGSVFVSVKTKGKLESGTTEVCYSAESQSTAPYSGFITVVNNVYISDTVTVTGLKATDLVKVYNAASAGTMLGYTTVTSGSTSVNILISQLGTGVGAVYVSVTEVGKTESNRTEADYVAETQTNAVSLASVSVINNTAGTADKITITGLTLNDVIQVYDQASDGNLLGTAVASSSGSVTISVPQLGASAGSVYITCTSSGKSESDRLKASYASE